MDDEREFTDNFIGSEHCKVVGRCPTGEHPGLFDQGHCPDCRTSGGREATVFRFHKAVLNTDGDLEHKTNIGIIPEEDKC